MSPAALPSPGENTIEYPRAANAGARGLFNAVSSKSCLPKCLPGLSLLEGALRGSCGPGCRLGLLQAAGRMALCSQEGVWSEYLGFNPKLGGQKQSDFRAKGLHTALASTHWYLIRGRDMDLSLSVYPRGTTSCSCPPAPSPVSLWEALLRPLLRAKGSTKSDLRPCRMRAEGSLRESPQGTFSSSSPTAPSSPHSISLGSSHMGKGTFLHGHEFLLLGWSPVFTSLMKPVAPSWVFIHLILAACYHLPLSVCTPAPRSALIFPHESVPPSH